MTIQMRAFLTTAIWIMTAVCLCRLPAVKGLPTSMKIGLLYEHDSQDIELAFKYAIKRINTRGDILPRTQLVPITAQVPRQDSFKTSKKVCHMLQEKTVAIFGPKSSLPAAHVQSICDSMDIPHIETKWDSETPKEYFTINIHPHFTALSRAFKDAIDSLGWDKFTILYETNEGLARLQDVVNVQKQKKYQLTIRKLEAENGDYRPILKEMKQANEFKVMVDCKTELVETVLTQAISLQMLTPDHHYMFTTLDLALVKLDLFTFSPANITAFRLVDPRNPKVVDVTSDWAMQEKRSPKSSPLWGREVVKTDVALIYDAVYLFSRSLHDSLLATDIDPQQLSCRKPDTWDHGSTLINYVKMTQISGMTGNVVFDNEGVRSDVELQLTELHTNGSLVMIGEWSTQQALNITYRHSDTEEKALLALKNNTLRITTIEDEPFVKFSNSTEDGEILYGNDRFSGYCIDLLKKIAEENDFKYEIHLVGDKNYGSPVDPEQPLTTKWNGMVGELVENKADLAVAPLTITYIREQVIDFTKPYMNLGISIIFKRPEGKKTNLFSFLSPLSIEVWLYVFAAYVVVSVMLFVLARFSPYEWVNPHPCNPESDVVENQFTLLNSLWFTIGSLMQQGCEIAPRAMSTRIISCIWWFFTLIMISSYTANLAAFLTVERMISPITSAEDLSQQTKIKYGTVANGSTYTFFKTSKLPTYERMWKFMSKNDGEVFVASNKAGIDQVEKGGYAFLLESTVNEYFVQRRCDLMQIGGLLDSKGYGIGTRRGSLYRDRLSDAILKLQEEQEMHTLYDKWWKQKNSGLCPRSDSNKEANSLGVGNVGGVFVALLIGLATAVIVAIFEFVWKARKNADEDKQSLCSEMAEELRFAIRCAGSSKKPAVKASKRELPEELYEHALGNGLTNYHTQYGGLMPGDTNLQMKGIYG